MVSRGLRAPVTLGSGTARLFLLFPNQEDTTMKANWKGLGSLGLAATILAACGSDTAPGATAESAVASADHDGHDHASEAGEPLDHTGLDNDGAQAAPAPPAGDGHDHDHDHGSESDSTVAGSEEPGRYGSRLETLDTGFDLSKLKVESPEVPVARPQAAPGAAASGVLPAVDLTGGLELAAGELTHDFGTIREGDRREHVFELVANGDQATVIKGVKPSCGCTKAEISIVGEGGELQPYERGAEIPVGTRFQLATEVSTEGKAPGPFSAQVSLYGNYSEPMNLRLLAEIEPVLVVEPTTNVFLGQMTSADTNEGSVTIRSQRGEAFALTADTEHLHESVKVDLTPVSPDAEGKANQWEVKLVLGPNAPIGVRNFPIQLSSDLVMQDPSHPNEDGTPKTYGAMLGLQAQVTGMVHAEPGFLSFGILRPGQTAERVVRIQCHDDFKLGSDIPVEIKGLQDQEFPYADAFSVALEPVVEEGVPEGSLLDVRVTLEGLPDGMNGSFGGILDVQVKHPWMESLQVRFSGVCRPGL